MYENGFTLSLIQRDCNVELRI